MCLFNGSCLLFSKKSLLYPKVTKTFLFSSGSFFIQHLCLMSVYSAERSRFVCFSHIKIQLFPQHLLKMLSSPLNYLGTSVRKQFHFKSEGMREVYGVYSSGRYQYYGEIVYLKLNIIRCHLFYSIILSKQLQQII